MKSLMLLINLSFALLFLYSCSSDKATINPSDVPESVKNSFQEKYKTSKVIWEKEGDLFEAEFEKEGVEMSVVYDKSGNVMETETEIEFSDLPAAIVTYLNENYPDAEIEEAESIENLDGNFFELAIETIDNEEIELVFSENGGFINIESEDEGDGEDEEIDEEEVEIEISELPQAVLSYLDESYPGYAILEAEKETNNSGNFIDVEIEDGDGNTLELVFDRDGNFLEIEEDDN